MVLRQRKLLNPVKIVNMTCLCSQYAQQSYVDEHAFLNQYYIQMKECIEYNLNTAYTQELFGKDNVQEYYNHVNEIHYLYFLLNYVLDAYHLWETNYDGTITQAIRDAKIAEIKAEYNFACMIRHFRCFGCDIGFIMTLFCSTPAPIGNSTQSVCTSGTVADLVAYGTNIQWYSTTTGTIPLNPTTPLVNGTHYYATQTVGTCESPTRFDVYVTINTLSVIPTSVSASSSSICEGESTVLSYSGGSLGTNAVAKWYKGSCGSIYVGQGNNLSVSPTTTTTYYVRFEDPAPCSENTSCLSVTIIVSTLPEPSFIVEPDGTSCVGTYVIYTTEAGQTNYSWSVPGIEGIHYNIIAGGLGATDSTVTLEWLVQGTYVVTVNYENSNGCEGLLPATNTLIVNVLPVVVLTQDPGGVICYDSVMTIEANTSAYDTFVWSHNGQGTLDLDDTLYPVYYPSVDDAGNNVVVSITVTYNDCEITEQTTIEIAPLAVAGDVTGGTTICEGSTSGVLTLSGYSGTIIRWEQSVYPFSTWTPIVNINDTYTSGSLSQTTYFRAVVQEFPCGVVYSTCTIVTVTPIPDIPLYDVDQYFCQALNPFVQDIINNIIIAVGTITVYDQATPDPAHLVDPQTPIVDRTTYYLLYTVDDCYGDTFPVIAHLLIEPEITLDTPVSICAGELSVLLPILGTVYDPTIYSIVWDDAALADGFINVTDAPMPSGTDFNILIPSGNIHGSYTGLLTPSHQCVGFGSTFTIEIYENPDITLTDMDFTVYDTDVDFDIAYTGANGIPDEYQITWDDNAITNGFLDVAWTALGASPITVILPTGGYNPIAIDVYYGTLQVRNTTTGCLGPEMQIIVTVIATPLG